MSKMKAANALFFFMNTALFLIAGWFIYSRGYQPGTGFSQYELITLVLSALAVLLTALGLFIAAIAVWGYGTLRQAAIEQAREAAIKAATETAESIANRTAEGLFANAIGKKILSNDYGVAAGKEDGNVER